MPVSEAAISRSTGSELLKACCANAMGALAQRGHPPRWRAGAAEEEAAQPAVVSPAEEGEGFLASAAGVALLVRHPLRLQHRHWPRETSKREQEK